MNSSHGVDAYFDLASGSPKEKTLNRPPEVNRVSQSWDGSACTSARAARQREQRARDNEIVRALRDERRSSRVRVDFAKERWTAHHMSHAKRVQDSRSRRERDRRRAAIAEQ